jgi:hypothetical protein
MLFSGSVAGITGMDTPGISQVRAHSGERGLLRARLLPCAVLQTRIGHTLSDGIRGRMHLPRIARTCRGAR